MGVVAETTIAGQVLVGDSTMEERFLKAEIAGRKGNSRCARNAGW
jgi:hypothetical protein